MIRSKKAKNISLFSFYRFTKGLRHHFLMAMILTLVAIVANYMTPQVIRITVDSVLGDTPFNLPNFVVNWINQNGGREMLRNHLVLCAAFAVLFALISGFSTYFSRKHMSAACEGTICRLRNQLFEHVQKLPFSWYNKNQTGDIIQRCTMDTDIIRNFISEQLLNLVRIFILIVVSLALMFSMDVKLSLIALFFLPLVVTYSLIFYCIMAKKFRAADEKEGELTALVQENLTGVRVVRAFGREQHEIHRFVDMNETYTNYWIRIGKTMGLNWSIGDFLSGLQVLVILIAGSMAAVNGRITTGEFLAFFSYNSMLVWPSRSLGRVLGEFSKTKISAVRLFDILDAEPELEDEHGLTPPMNGDIVFDHVSFGYLPDQEVLHDLTFTIPAGSTFGILGATGSGKSTLVCLLDRLYELPKEQGTITVGGVDLRDIRLSHLRSQVGIVLQEPFLFSKSFRENIADGRFGATEAEVRHAAAIAQIDDSILHFADGYDTPIGERGVTVSGGQKQRTAIARMLLQQTPIQIFDDSLSAVDMETDEKIREALKQELHSTTILIAHRITTLMHADCILVLDHGKIAQMGTHEELLQQDGIYRRIYNIQNASEGGETNG